ncbi:hypothetical protein BC827DRAFT_1385229 [Russula dissimulans]|nr:hypothetical protein BC827DRAFT_1385229 [Russula dissimulans]
MADVGQQYPNHFPENAFSTAGATWEAATLPVPQRPRSPPLPHLRRDHVVPQDAQFLPVDAANNRQPYGHREDIIPPVDNIVAQDQPQDPRYVDMAYYNMAHHRPLQQAGLVAPHGYHDRGMDNYARVVQEVAAQPQAVAPLGPRAAADPAPAFLYEGPHQHPILNEPAREVLRRLASRYVNQPDAHLNMPLRRLSLACSVILYLLISPIAPRIQSDASYSDTDFRRRNKCIWGPIVPRLQRTRREFESLTSPYPIFRWMALHEPCKNPHLTDIHWCRYDPDTRMEVLLDVRQRVFCEDLVSDSVQDPVCIIRLRCDAEKRRSSMTRQKAQFALFCSQLKVSSGLTQNDQRRMPQALWHDLDWEVKQPRTLGRRNVNHESEEGGEGHEVEGEGEEPADNGTTTPSRSSRPKITLNLKQLPTQTQKPPRAPRAVHKDKDLDSNIESEDDDKDEHPRGRDGKATADDTSWPCSRAFLGPLTFRRKKQLNEAEIVLRREEKARK